MKNEYLSDKFIRSCFSGIEYLVQNLLDPVLPEIDRNADTVRPMACSFKKYFVQRSWKDKHVDPPLHLVHLVHGKLKKLILSVKARVSK